jgi:hypothetical protein
MKQPERRKDLPWLRQVSSFFVSRVILTANNFRVTTLPLPAKQHWCFHERSRQMSAQQSFC